MDEEFFQRLSDKILEIIDNECLLEGIDNKDLLFQFFIGVIDEEGDVDRVAIHRADNKNEMMWMLEEVEKAYNGMQPEGKAMWEGFGLN
jgi:hypothetical protein